MATAINQGVIEISAERVCKDLRAGKMPNWQDLQVLSNCREHLPADVAQRILDKLADETFKAPISYALCGKILRDVLGSRGWYGK